MLAPYVNDEQSNWDQILPFVMFAYRTSVHSSTGFTPFYLIHGVDARYPMDVSLQPSLSTPPPVKEYVTDLQKKLAAAYDIVRENNQQAQQKQAYWYNQKVKPAREFEIGSLVMQFCPVPKANPKKKKKFLSSLPKRSKKLDYKWDGPFEVVQKLSNLTYRLRDPASRKKPWTIHVSRIKPYISVLGRKNYQDDFDVDDSVPSAAEAESHYYPDGRSDADPSTALSSVADQAEILTASHSDSESVAASDGRSVAEPSVFITSQSSVADLDVDNSTTVPFVAKDSSHPSESSDAEPEVTSGSSVADSKGTVIPGSLASFNNTSLTTLTNKTRLFQLTPVDSDWHLAHIEDAAVIGPSNRGSIYYLVSWTDSPAQSWLSYDQVRSYEKADRALRKWDAELENHLKQLRRQKLKKKTSAAPNEVV